MRILFAMQALSRKAFHKMPGTEELLNDFEKKRVKWKYRELDECDEAELENRNGALLVVTDSSNLAQTLSDRKICCVGFQKPSDTSFFTGASVVLNTFQELDTDFFVDIWKRFCGIPVTIARTSRLLIRESCEDDFEKLFEISRETGNDRYTETMTADKDGEREKFLAYIRQMYEYYGFGLWTVEEENSGAVIGRCGLFPAFDDEMDTEVRIELGYLIGQDYRRQGFALEACEAILEYAFTELDLREVFASIHEGNLASKNLISALGFVFCRIQTEAAVRKDDSLQFDAKHQNGRMELWKILRK